MYAKKTWIYMLVVVAAVMGANSNSVGSINGQQEDAPTIAQGQDGQPGESGNSMGNGTSIDGADGEDGQDGVVENTDTVPDF